MKYKHRKKFTEWYRKMGYAFNGIEFRCPWYVKPFLFLFSPSIYFYKLGEEIKYEID